jgi:hypothetical protein
MNESDVMFITYLIALVISILMIVAQCQLFGIKRAALVTQRAALDIQRTLNQLAILKQREMGLTDDEVVQIETQGVTDAECHQIKSHAADVLVGKTARQLRLREIRQTSKDKQ